MSNKNLQRRKFIKAGALGMAAFTIVPRHVLGRGHVAPSDKLRIAGIGAGGKGESDLSEFAKSPNVSIVAMADVDDRAAAKSRKAYPNANYYHDFSENAKVAVDIKVDDKGNVISASIQPRGTTTSNASMKTIALQKARQLKFNTNDDGPEEDLGTIVFNFRIRN